jgi:hypothetical protein
MFRELKKTADVSADVRQANSVCPDDAQYAAPALYVIGRSRDLLQGSGRHKNDDTGSPGFTVDQR